MEALEVKRAERKHRAGPQASAVCQPVACMPPPAGAGASHHKAPSPKNPALLENFAASAGGAPAALRLSDRPGIAGPHMPLSNTQPEPPFARPAVPWAGSLALAPVGPALPLQRSSPGDLAQPLQRAALAAAAALSRATPQPLKQQQQGTLSAAQGLSQLMAARPASLNRADPAAAITVKPEPAAICRELRPTTPSAAPAPAAAVAAPAIPGPQPPSLASVLGKRKADGGPLDQPVPQQTLLPAPGALALGVPMLPHLSAASTAPVLGRPLASAAPPAGLLPAAQTPALYSYTRGVGGEVRAGTDEEEDGASAGVAWGVGAPPDTATAGEARKARLVWTQELHNRFINALSHLGLKNAVPKSILAMMDVDGMSRENVASHLQKYRLYLRRLGGFSSKDRGDADALQRMHERNVQAMAAQMMQQRLVAMRGAQPGMLLALGHTHYAAAAAGGAAAPSGTLETLAAAALHIPPLASPAAPAVHASSNGVAAGAGQGSGPWLLPLPGHAPAPSSMPESEDAGVLRTGSGNGGAASAAAAASPPAQSPGAALAAPTPGDHALVSAAVGGANRPQPQLPLAAGAQVGSCCAGTRAAAAPAATVGAPVDPK